MSVDMETLIRQCVRWDALPVLYSSEASAHALLEKLPIPPGTILQFALGREWQLSISGEVIKTGSFEDCVTALAVRCEP